MLDASSSNFAWPNTTWPCTTSLTTARLHRSPVDVAVPVHSPSCGPLALALLNCGMSSKKAAVPTLSGPFITKPSPLYVIRRRYHATPAVKEMPQPNGRGKREPIPHHREQRHLRLSACNTE